MAQLPTLEAMKTWPTLLPGLHWRSLQMPSKTEKKVLFNSNAKIHYKAYHVQESGELILLDASFYSDILSIPACSAPQTFSIGTKSIIPAWEHLFSITDTHAGVFVGDGVEFYADESLCYGSAGSPPKVPSNANLYFQLLVVDAVVDSNSPTEVAVRAKMLKDAGNKFYQEANHQQAADTYMKALDEMRFVFAEKDADQEAINAIRLVCNLNRAACQLKLQDYAGAKQSCSDALYIEPNNVKALYRRAQASAATFDFERALRDVIVAIKQSPADQALRQEFARIKEQRDEYDKKTKEVMASMSKGMFSS